MNISKTISQTPEVALKAHMFCQPIDIAIDLSGNETIAMPNMDGYPMRSTDNAVAYINDVMQAGIQTVMLRMNAPTTIGDASAIIARQAEVLETLRAHFNTLTIIVDPFSVALNKDKTWGVLQNGKLNYKCTTELFAEITEAFMDAGASYILALGRFEREVDVAARTIAAEQLPTQVASFSTNTETTNAYVYADHGAYAITGQKILVSNSHEMTFRALVDIYEGSNMIIVKPAENLHILERLKTMLTHEDILREFMTSSTVKTMVQHSEYLQSAQQAIADNPAAFMAKAATVCLGTYTVSGTYFMDTQTLARKGNDFLASLLYERFCNSASVLQDAPMSGLIIDRNAYWYITHHAN